MPRIPAFWPALWRAVAALLVAGAALVAAPLSAQARTLPVNYDFAAGALAGFGFPQTPPPGADNFGCKPSSAHPDPVTLVNGGLNALCTACVQQEVGSSFLASLNADGDTVGGVSYTVVESRNDEVVTPYTSAFLSGSGVTNITLQNQCALDQSDHLEIAADPVALADVLNALDPAHPVRVPCLDVLPITGPVGPVPSF